MVGLIIPLALRPVGAAPVQAQLQQMIDRGVATLSARQGDCLQFAAWAEAAARLEPGVRERLVAAHPACE